MRVPTAATSGRPAVEGDDAGASCSGSGQTAPDFENPKGGASNDSNTYMVTLKATADGEMDTHDVTVTVTDVEEMVTGDPLLAEYDPDGDGTIEKADMRRAVSKFFVADPQAAD